MLVALSLCLYAGTLGHGFPFDDEMHVLRDLDVRRLDGLVRAFREPTWPGNLYRPLVRSSYVLTHAAFGLHPLAYHATNVALNAIVVALAYLLLRRLVDEGWAFAAAVIFAVHPAHVEVVASVANRTELLAAALGLASLLVLLGPAGRGARTRPRAGGSRLALAAALFLGATLSKESAFVFLPLAALCLRAERGGEAGGWRRSAPALAALGAAAAISLGLRFHALGGGLPSAVGIPAVDNPLVALPAWERMARATVLLGKYALLVAVPLAPSADYSLGTPAVDGSLASGAGALQLAALLALVGGTVFALRRRHPAGVLGLWFFVAFALTANVAFPVGTVFADRLAYLPSLGLCGAIAWGLARLRSRPVRLAATAGLVAVLALRSLTYAAVWRDNASLFAYEMQTSPGSVKVQVGWAEALARAGVHGEARRHFEAAMRIDAAYPNAPFGLAVLALEEGRREEGVAWLERTLAVDPGHVTSLVLLGRLALRAGRSEEAAGLFARALASAPGSFDARLGLLAVALERGELGRASRLRDELVRRDPANPELAVLARQLDRDAAAGEG